MPVFALAPMAATAFWGAVGAGAAAGATIYGANKSSNAATTAAQTQSKAATDAAKLQTDATTHAADLSAKSAADTLAFQKQQADQDFANANATGQANYNQWAARENRLSNFQQMLGMSGRDIPAYEPLKKVDTTGNPLPSTTTTPTSSTLPTGQTPSGAASTGDLSNPSAWMALVGNDSALKAWITQGLGSAAQTPGLVDYYAKVIKGQPGANASEQAGSAAYYLQKFAADPNNTGKTAATKTVAPANSMASAVYTPTTYAPNITPALQMPTTNSMASYLGYGY